MHIRMLRNSPCSIAYGGFHYRVEPVKASETHESYIAARLVTAAGDLFEPVQEQVLTPNFSGDEGAAAAWSVGFETKDSYFLLRALVYCLLDYGYAEELEQSTPLPVARTTLGDAS